MAQTYYSVLDNVYRGYAFTRHCRYERNKCTPSKYMEIPVNKDIFELPTFALSQFLDTIKAKPDLETLVAELYSGGATPNYATLSRYMKDILQERLSTHLIKIAIPVQNHDPIIYYGTHGAVFNRYLEPIMMCLWQVSRTPKPDVPTSYDYHLERPILKVSPNCFLRQADPMERFLAKKLPAEALALNIRCLNSEEAQRYKRYTVKVEIDKFPFTLKEGSKPSTSISDDSLIQIARDHIEEIEL